MSVINRMLQDLQDRKAGLASSPGMVMPVAAKPPGTQRLLVLLAGGSALIAAVAYAPMPMLGEATAAHTPQPVAVGAAPAPLAPTAPLAVAVAMAASQAQSEKAMPTTSPAPLHPLPVVAKPVAVTTIAATAPASSASPTSVPVPVLAQVDKRVLAETPRQRAQNFYRQGADQAATGHVRQAVDLALEALKADPGYGEARHFAVALMYEQQRVAEAEALAREGLAMSRHQGQLAYLLARMLSERGSNQEAVALLDQQPNLTADGHGLRAGILSQSGDFKRASQDYQSAAMQQPDNSLWWFGLGVALEALGQPQEARRVYAKAQSLGMDRPDLTAFIDQKLRTLN
jgi:MSHA biogenesis protein MshN